MERFANNATTTLNGTINNLVTSVVVTSGSVFPNSGNFRIIIDSEVMLVTAVSGNTLTVTRGSEGTTAASHTTGATVNHILTQGSIRQLMSDYSQIGTFSSRPTAGFAGRTYHFTDVPWITKSVDDGTNWRNFWNGLELLSPPTSGWSWNNNTAGHVVASSDRDSLLFTADTTGSSTFAMYYRSLYNTSPYKITFGIISNYNTNTSNVSVNATTGLAICDDTFKFKDIEIIHEASQTLGHYKWTNATTFSAAYLNRTPIFYASPPIFFQVEDDGTNTVWRVSTNGLDFYHYFQETRTDWVTATKVSINLITNFSTTRLIHYKEG